MLRRCGMPTLCLLSTLPGARQVVVESVGEGPVLITVTGFNVPMGPQASARGASPRLFVYFLRGYACSNRPPQLKQTIICAAHGM